MSYLVLGGTQDALSMARWLIGRGVPVIYSLAGKVRVPDIDCPVVTGGFSAIGGMAEYIQQQNIRGIVDLTHPYAAQISANAMGAAQQAGIPCWRYERPVWQSTSDDRWIDFESWSALLPLIEKQRSIFFAIGQLPQVIVDFMEQQTESSRSRYVVRSAVEQLVQLPKDVTRLKAIGPFTEGDEEALFNKHAIDGLVCKNSGGSAMFSKMAVARKFGVPVFILKRPNLEPADVCFDDLAACEAFVFNHHQQRLR
ncbi:MAG: cobalt-precorrin-6A reductase [Pseudomonadales bacterium]|nr:cobalt-precorrin-6A reductase [Pseudomonadales bacterium]